MSFSTLSNKTCFNPNFFQTHEQFCSSFLKNQKAQPTNRLYSAATPINFSLIIQKLKTPKNYFKTRKEIEDFFDEIAELDFENATEREMNTIVGLLVDFARKGTEGESPKKLLEKDIFQLYEEDHFNELCFSFSNQQLTLDSPCKLKVIEWCSKKAKKICRFVKKHKKAVIITAAVVAGVAVAAVVTVAVVNTVGMAALAEGVAVTGSAIGTAAGTSQSQINEKKEPSSKPESLFKQSYDTSETNQIPSKEITFLENNGEIAIDSFFSDNSQVTSTNDYDIDFKERFQTWNEREDIESNLLVAGLNQTSSMNDYENQIDLDINEKVFSSNPTLAPIPQSATFDLTKDFCKGYTKGIIQGAKDSGSDWIHLTGEFVAHPVKTTGQIIDAFRDLSHLALSDQWAELSEVLCPEAYKLATEWNYLSSEERGRLAGYTTGKVGADILIPGTAAKLAAKGVKGAKKLLNISKALQEIEGSLALEGVATKTGVPLVNEPNPINQLSPSTVSNIIFGKGNFTVEKLLEAGKAIDRQGLTKAGRGLAKHGGRNPSVFPKPMGNPVDINLRGQQILESIINHPNRVTSEGFHPQFGKVIKFIVPDKWGVWFTIDGEMIGFLEP